MTQKSKLKHAARARAKATGESYAAARRQVVHKIDNARSARTLRTAAEARGAKAIGTITEARCIEKTGHGFDHWFAVLDRFGAVKKGHKLAARHLCDDHGVPGWYAQAVTVSYERARGLRAVNQRCEGSYEVSVSRVLPVSLDAAVRALAEPRRRKRWLEAAGPLGAELATALDANAKRRPGLAILRFATSGAKVELHVLAKDDGRCSIVAVVKKLADRAAVERARAAWRQALDALRTSLASAQP